LIRYLLDELYTYEEDHSDALNPINTFGGQSHMGEDTEMAPISVYECRELFLKQAEDTKRLAEHVQRLEWTLAHGGSTSFAAHPALPPPFQATQSGMTALYLGPSFPVLIGPEQGYAPAIRQGPLTPFLVGPCQAGDGLNHQRAGTTVLPVGLSSSGCFDNQPSAMRLEQNHNYSVILSEPRHIVPEIGRGYGERAWLRAVKDWENTDGSRGLDTPLKDWDPKWLKESGQSTKYHQREIVALEFISRFAVFLNAYRFALNHGPLGTSGTRMNFVQPIQNTSEA
jgi:hypothetical protein